MLFTCASGFLSVVCACAAEDIASSSAAAIVAGLIITVSPRSILRGIGRRSEQDQALPEARRNRDFVLRADDDALHTGRALDEGHPRVRTEDEYPLCERVGNDRAVGDQRDAAAQTRRLSSGQIEDVMIAPAI